MTAPEPVHRPPAAARDRPARFRSVAPRCSTGKTAEPEDPADRARPARLHRARASPRTTAGGTHEPQPARASSRPASSPSTPTAASTRPPYRRYLQWLLPQGPVALAINADTGEGPHLWPDERERVLRVAVDEAGDVPVIAGLSAPVHGAGRRGGEARPGRGRAGLLVFPIPAYQGTPLDPAIPVAYHEAIAAGCGLPMVAFQLQPALGGVIFTEETLRRIAAIDNVVALKEASFDARLYLLTRRMIESLDAPDRPADRRRQLHLRVVRDGRRGSADRVRDAGDASSRSRWSELTVEGRWDEARAIWERILPLEEVVYGAPVRDYRARTKVALRELGVIESTVMRPPLLAVGRDETQADPRRARRGRPAAREVA